MTNTAFELITTRQAWYAAEELNKYDAAMFNAQGKLVPADGTGPFAGIVQYGAEKPDRMVTIVRGTFPAVGSEDIVAGAKVTADTTSPGKFKTAGEGDVIYGVALTDAIAGNLFSVFMTDIPA